MCSIRPKNDGWYFARAAFTGLLLAFFSGAGCRIPGSASGFAEFEHSTGHGGQLRLDQLTYDSPASKEKTIALWAAVQREPGNPDSRFQLARVLLRNQYPAPAITLLDHAACKQPANPLYFLLLSAALQMHSPAHLPRVIHLLQDGQKQFPQNAPIHTALGHAHNTDAKAEAALAQFDQALLAKPDREVLLSARLGRAASFRKLGRSQEAERELAEARRIFPGLDKSLREARILEQVPAPVYLGTIEDDGVHPEPSERSRRVLEEIDRLSQKHK